MVLHRVGPVSVCAKIAGYFTRQAGFIIGGVISMAAMAGGFASDSSIRGAGFGAIIGVGAIVFFPLAVRLHRIRASNLVLRLAVQRRRRRRRRHRNGPSLT